MMENQIYKFIAWVKASKTRKRVVLISTILYTTSFALYLVFFFNFKNIEVARLKLRASFIFYLLLWVFALTFKKQIKNEN